MLASFPARLAYGMVGLGIFFKVQRETGSVAFAGLALGLNSIGGNKTLFSNLQEDVSESDTY